MPDDGYEIEDGGENLQLFKDRRDLESGKIDGKKLSKPGTHLKFIFLNFVK